MKFYSGKARRQKQGAQFQIKIYAPLAAKYKAGLVGAKFFLAQLCRKFKAKICARPRRRMF